MPVNPSVAEDVTSYTGQPLHEASKATPTPEASKAAAAYYDKVLHTPHDPRVAASYEALKRETVAQYKHLLSRGATLEPWTQPGQPYANSREMMEDVAKNRHLYFFTGGDMPPDHPLAALVPGTNLTHNDVFRAVHDWFGHALHGHQFGATGEYRAWHDHSHMYSREAIPALTAETHGQNSWVNFGPHSHLPVTERPYAEQKAFVMPEEHTPRRLARLKAPAGGGVSDNQYATGGRFMAAPFARIKDVVARLRLLKPKGM